MKKIKRCLVLAAGAVLAVSLAAQSGSEWAVSFGDQSSDNESGYFSLNCDNSGNLYVSGTYIYSIAFGSHVLSTPQTGQDIYLAKKAASGEWLWAVSAVGSAASESRNYVDPSGNCFLYGEYLNTLTFGAQTLSNGYSPSRKQAFIAQVDSNGNWLWAQNIALNYLNGLCRDAAGNFFLCGHIIDAENSIFESQALKLDPALQPVWNTLLSTEFLYTKEIHLDQYGWIECVAKQQYMWLTPGGTVAQTIPLPAIYMDFAFAADGSKYYRGYADEPLILGGQSVPVGGFLAKLVNSEFWAWVQMDGSPDYGYGGGVAVNAAGDVYISGGFTGMRTFGDLTLTNSGGADIFIAKAGSGFGVWQWAKQGGGLTVSDAVRYNGIEIDPLGNIYLWGSFAGDISLGSADLSTATPTDIYRFIAKFDEPTLELLLPQPGGIWTIGGINEVTWDYTCAWKPWDMDFAIVDVPSEALVYGMDVDADVRQGSAIVDTPNLDPGMYGLKAALVDCQVGDVVPLSISDPAPLSPQNVRSEVEGNNIALNWDPVTQDANGNPVTPTGYQVYVSANPTAGFFAYGPPVQDTQFTDYNSAQVYGRRFYRVVALVDPPGNPDRSKR